MDAIAHRRRPFAVAAITACFAVAGLASGASACRVPPNVIFLVDTSGSMAHISWHPAFNPSVPTSCTSHTETLQLLNDQSQARCGTLRSYRVDPMLEAQGIPTRFDPAYLNWMHDLPNGHPYLSQIEASDSGTLSSCLGGGSFPAYRESRLSAAQRFLDDVICRTTSALDPRLGIARLRVASDPAGGYLAAPVENDTPAQAVALASVIDELAPVGWGPLGEALFHTYTYLMGRNPTGRPYGVDDFTLFPAYASDTVGNPTSIVPPSPIEDGCQGSHVILLGDDAPTKDDFDPAGPGSDGFQDFDALIGNFNPDDTYPEAFDEEPGVSPTCTSGSCEVALYLDDIAMFMRDTDLRPDLVGVQRVMVHAVGFGLEPFGRALFEKTASAGGGLFLLPGDAGVLADEIIALSTPPPPPMLVPGLGRFGSVLTLCALVTVGLLGLRRMPESVGSG